MSIHQIVFYYIAAALVICIAVSSFRSIRDLIKIRRLRKAYLNSGSLITLSDTLELSIKSGRRLMHDFDHLLDDYGMLELRIREMKGEDVTSETFSAGKSQLLEVFEEKARHWRTVFYPTRGMKDYTSRLHQQMWNLECEIERLKKLCEDNNIDTEDPNAIPF